MPAHFGSPWTAQAPFAADHIQVSATSDEVVIETLAGETVGSVRFKSRRPERLMVPWSRLRSLPPRYKMSEQAHIDTRAKPSGTGCRACGETGGWWFHLRRCAQCGNIGCCDSSPSQHARRHAEESGHPIVRSFEPGEDWFWNFATNRPTLGQELEPPAHHPRSQPTPGPAGLVPPNWRSLLHADQ